MAENIRVFDIIPARPEEVFAAWLDAERHGAFTGAEATTEGVGGTFTAWDGYIQGTTFEAEPHRRIVQSWRTTEFPAESPPSRLEVLLEPTSDGTRLTLVHTEIPDGQGAQYEQGWRDHYFKPMKQYFGTAEAIPHAASPTVKAVKAKAKAKKQPARRAPKRKAAPKRAAKSAKRPKAKARSAKRKAPRRKR